MSKVIIALDATEIDNFGTCKYKWDLFHHRRIVPKTTKSYLESGSLIHYLEERYYLQKMETPKVDQSELERIVEEGRMESLKYSLELDEISDIIFQFREYVRYYTNEQPEYIIPVHVEKPFMVKIYEDEELVIYITGKPDLVFMYEGSFNLNIMDHKKVSRDSQISPLRNQFMMYATAFQTDTVIVNKIGFQKTLKPKDRFKRVPFVYNQDILDEWKQVTIWQAKQMVLYEKAKYYPQEHSSCEKWDGCWYQRWCTTKPRAREFLLGSEYIIGEQWDVTKKLEMEEKK